jgi:sugar-specific transcriptional regulator TrmB
MIFKKVYGRYRVINICYCNITVTVNVTEGLPCMHALERDVKVLIEFGLTGNQARVYLAIARLKLATVGQISKVSKVRREDVYRILPKLEKMGLVQRLLGKPTKIRATPAEDALSILIKHEEDTARKRVSALKTKTKTFLKHFALAPRLELEETTSFTLLAKRENIMSKIMVLMKKAEKNIDLVCSRTKLTQLIHELGEQINDAAKKDVKIRIVSEMHEPGDSIPRIIEEQTSLGISLDLRYTDLHSGHYIIVDFKEALIATTASGNLAENPLLWTNSDSLVEVFQKDFENLWHNATSWKYIETTAVPEKVIRSMEQLRPTNHLIFVYDSPEAKYNVLFNYLKVGVDKGEAGVYVTSDEDPSKIREAMKRVGIKVKKYEETSALHIIGYEDVYVIDGKFSMPTTMNILNKLYNEALKQGFKGLRVTGEMACFFKHHFIQELIEYEKALHRTLDIPIIVVCAYNADMLNKSKDPVNLYSELARAHGTVLFSELDNKLGKMEIKHYEHTSPS